MFSFTNDQKIFEVSNIKIGGQPGMHPTVLFGGLFFWKGCETQTATLENPINAPKEIALEKKDVSISIDKLAEIQKEHTTIVKQLTYKLEQGSATQEDIESLQKQLDEISSYLEKLKPWVSHVDKKLVDNGIIKRKSEVQKSVINCDMDCSTCTDGSCTIRK